MKIHLIDITNLNAQEYPQYVGCIVLNKDNKIVLQERPDNWPTYPGCLATFGGRVEEGEIVFYDCVADAL